jgi:pyruvate,orthophosphate dikinase
MQFITGLGIRDFRIRGNYLNQHTLVYSRDLRSRAQTPGGPHRPGYSQPVVEYELMDGRQDTVDASEMDVPLLCASDLNKAKSHLALLVNAARGHAPSIKELDDAMQRHAWQAVAPDRLRLSESEFVVPCTSNQKHSERDISQKAFILLKLTRLGYPVPDFVVLTSQVYSDAAQSVEKHLREAVEQLQTLTMQRLGCSNDPLVLAVRCATAHYVPGVMDTFLNVGVTERTLPQLEKVYGAAAARKMFLNNLRNLCDALEGEESSALIKAVRSDLPPDECTRLIEQLSDRVRRNDPVLLQDAFAQAAFVIGQAYKHFEENHDLLATLCRGTGHIPALILQKMVCTVRHEEAYAGVISSRHTQTGIGMELQTARNIFGEEMMTGTAEVENTAFMDSGAIKDSFPAVYHFVSHLPDLERDFESPVTIELAVEATPRCQWFALLQLNETGMAGRAAVTAVVDMHKSGIVSRKRVTELIRPYHIKQITSDSIDQESFAALTPFCSGISVLPRSAVSGRLYFSGEAALTAKSRGEKVCL